MTPLRQRMLEDMQLRGLSARTPYVAAVRQLAEHFHTSPAQLTEEQLRQYFLYLANEKHVARTTATIALCAIRFLYEQTLHQPWPTLRFVRPAPSTRLPSVLSRDEVRQILGLVRIRVYRECLTTIYAGGLRLLEGARIQIADVDSGRMVLHVHGKGNRDRYVPLPAPLFRGCATTGAPIGRASGSSRPRRVVASSTASRTRAGRSRAAVCKVRFVAHGGKAGWPNAPACTRCDIRTGPTSMKRG